MVAFLTELFASKTLAEWESWFADRDICWAPVKNLREAFDDPHVQARHMRLNETADIEHVGSPFKFQRTKTGIVPIWAMPILEIAPMHAVA